MAAEICCCDPDVGASVTAVLIERGYDVELLSWVDDEGRAVWLMARILTELAAGDFLDQVRPLSRLKPQRPWSCRPARTGMPKCRTIL
jgi:hypothetical protein